MAGYGIYTSTYKKHYIWPPHIPRKTASIENPTYPELCGKGEPLCICEQPVCLCGQGGKGVRREGLPECDLDSWAYLKGTKSVYSQSYDKPVRLQPLKRRYRGPDPDMEDFQPPRSHFPNPYLLGKDVYRPGLPRSTKGSGLPPAAGHAEKRDEMREPKIEELVEAMRFPEELQDRIVRIRAFEEKLSLGRARPKQSN